MKKPRSQSATIRTLPAPVFDENSGLPPKDGYQSSRFSDLVFSRELYRSSAFRLGLAISTIYLFCFAVAWGLSYQFLQDSVVSRADAALERRYDALLELYNQDGLDAVIEVGEVQSRSPILSDGGFQIRDVRGKSIAGNIDTKIKEMGLRTDTGAVMGLPEQGSVRFLVGLLGVNTVTFAISLSAMDDIREDATRNFVKLFLLSMGLGLLGSLYAAWRTHGRIDRIIQIMRAVAAGELERRLPTDDSGDDIDEFSIRVNDALDRLQQNVDGLRQMSSDMAHELKTPLNRLYIQLEGAATKLYEKGVEIEEVGRAMDEAENINSTFQAILRIAQIEAGARKSAFQPVNIIEVVGTVAEMYEPVLEEVGNSLQKLFDPNEELYVMGDRELLIQAVVNLLENTIKHCPSGSIIFVDVGEYHGEPWFRVADNGLGIPENMREKVFQRMFRLEESRTTSGTGLGMTLVKAVAELHCASVTLGDNNPGLSITVKFEEECPG